MLTTGSPVIIGPTDGESVTLQTIGVRFIDQVTRAGLDNIVAEQRPMRPSRMKLYSSSRL